MSSLITDEFKLKYVMRRRGDLETLNKALTTSNFADIQKIGHQIKGNAATFEFSELAEIAISLEAYAIEKRADLIIPEVEKFKKWLESKETELHITT